MLRDSTGYNHIAKKQSRPSYVCTNCKRRKVKCDKNLPCTRCIKGGLQTSCTYNFEPHLENDCDKLKETSSHHQITPESINIEDNQASPEARPQIDRQNSFLFNYKSDAYKKPLFRYKKDLVEYNSPMFLKAIFDTNEKYLKFKALMPFLYKFKETDEYRKYSYENSRKELGFLHGIYSKEEIDSLIVQYIKPNFRAIKERIKYFSSDIKHEVTVATLAFFPDVIDQLNQCFKIEYDETGAEEIIYIPFEDFVDYAKLGIMFSILRLVSVLTEFESDDLFRYPLLLSSDMISEVILKCIAFSDFMRHPSIDALVALLFYRMTYFILGSLTDNNASYFLDLITNLTFKLGIHVRCDHIPGYDEDAVIKLWNLIQHLDAITSVHTGELLKIDYRYCVPRLVGQWEPLILYFRSIVHKLNSVSPISLNDIIELINSSTNFFSLFKPFDEILDNFSNKKMQNIFSVIVKGNFIICLDLLIFKLRLSLDEVLKLPVNISENDSILIEEMKIKSECCLFYSFSLAFKLMKTITGNTFSDKLFFSRLTISLRFLFTIFISFGNKLILCYYTIFQKGNDYKTLLSMLAEKRSKKNLESINISCSFDDISIEEAERYLCREFDSISLDDSATIKMIETMTSSSALTDFLFNFYESMSDKRALMLVGKFSIQYKFLLFICILMNNIREYQTKNPKTQGNQFTHEEWKKLLEISTEYLLNGYDPSSKNDGGEDSKNNSGDWDFLEQEEFLGNMGYTERLSQEEFDELYKLFL